VNEEVVHGIPGQRPLREGDVVTLSMNIPPLVSQFLGGTGLLIVVSVALDMVQRIEANLLMRNYGGFLSTGPGQKGKRIKGRQY
jgi:preprotein translocase subunit SecY